MKQLFGIALSSTLLLFIIYPSFVEAESSLFLQVPVKQVYEGDRITIDVKVQSPDQAINAVSGTLLFPDSLVKVVGVTRDQSIINLWTREPTIRRNKVLFEGIILNPGFQGANGTVFRITFEAKRTGKVTLTFTDGAVLANDGFGSNVVSALRPVTFTIAATGTTIPDTVAVEPSPGGTGRVPALPVITEYSASVDAEGAAYLKGKGEPNAMTKIVFKDTSFKSIGEQFILFLQTKRKKLDEVIVKNNANGHFEYQSPKKLVAGAYSATPYLVDDNKQGEKPGLGVQLFVQESSVVKLLVVIINVLALLIPVVGLIVVIYFIPWYSFHRMRVLKRKLGLEEEKIAASRHELLRKEKILDIPIVPTLTRPLSVVPQFPQRPFPSQDPKI